jgi:LysR family glycine cleavage system transcriptional activator
MIGTRKRHLPPLKALRAFEAAARHLHLGKAADELAVTHGAVSKQIANLEAHLGCMLFVRTGNRLSLTDQGTKLVAAANTALDQLEYAVAKLDGESIEGELRISVPSGFATKWLIPRLCHFMAIAPALKLQVLASNRFDEGLEQGTDVAVRFGRPMWKNCTVRLLSEVHYFPVCSPTLLSQPPGINFPEDLLQHTLLLDDPYGESWKKWFEFTLHRTIELRSFLYFEDFAHILAAARQGLGICLADNITAGSDLAEGHLARPYAQSISDRGAFYLIYPHLLSPAARIFADWIQAEMAEFSAQIRH